MHYNIKNCHSNFNSNFNNYNPSNNFGSNCNDFCIPYEQDTEFNELAKAFVLFQKFCGVLCEEDALVKGTAFEELYMPYKPMKKCKKTKMC